MAAYLVLDDGSRLSLGPAGGFLLFEATKPDNIELREQGDAELREDDSFELREGVDVEPTKPPRLRRHGLAGGRRRDGRTIGSALRIVARLRPGRAHGDALAPGVRIAAQAPRNGLAPGARVRVALMVDGARARAQTCYDRSVIDADLLALAGSDF